MFDMTVRPEDAIQINSAQGFMGPQVRTDRSFWKQVPRRGQGEVISGPLVVVSLGLSGNLDHLQRNQLKVARQDAAEGLVGTAVFSSREGCPLVLLGSVQRVLGLTGTCC